MTNTSNPISQGLSEAQAWLRGDDVRGARVRQIAPLNPKELRQRLDMTQSDFADTFQIPVSTLRGWEQGRRAPDATTVAYLTLIASEPERAKAALVAARS